MSDVEFGWDDRKTLLDIYYAGGGKVGEDLSLRDDIYWGLIAVANHALSIERYLEGAIDIYPETPNSPTPLT